MTFIRSDSGVTAVEFGLVATPLFFITGMILELGLVFFQMNSLHHAVEVVARDVRLNDLGPGKTDQIYQVACRNMILVSDCDGVFFLDVRSMNDSFVNPVSSSGFNPGGLSVKTAFLGGEIALVRGYLRWNFITRLPGLMMSESAAGDDIILSASTIHLVEEPF